MSELNLSSLKNKKIALVLSGGVVKAASWHLGVSLALEELGFVLKSNENSLTSSSAKRTLEISTYVGSSAGSMICLLLSLGFTPQEIVNSHLGIKNTRLKRIAYKDMLSLKRGFVKPIKSDLYHPLDEFPPIVRHLLKPLSSVSGLFTAEGIKKYLEKNVLTEINSFEQIKPDLFVVATQLDHSRKVIFSKYNYPNPTHDRTSVYYTGTSLSDSVTASMSVPPFYSPYPVKNSQTGNIDYYIDGEIRETLSTHVAEDNGCDAIISSWTHTPYHYHDEVGSLVNYGLSYIAVQSIYLMIQKKIIASRARRAMASDILNTVNDYLIHENFNDKHRRDLLSILEKKLHYKKNVKLIDIYPHHDDYKLFFANNFSLNPKTASYNVKAGYKRTMEVFSELEE
jgi:predicted acylesterase/phospholipase RssA